MIDFYVEIDDEGEHLCPIKALDFEEAAELPEGFKLEKDSD